MKKKRREMGKKNQGGGGQDRETGNGKWGRWKSIRENYKRLEILEEGRERKEKRNNIIIKGLEVLKEIH